MLYFYLPYLTNLYFLWQRDLILTNAKYDINKRLWYLDFNSSVVCQLDEMKKDGTILSVKTFFEKIFRFAEKASGDDLTWGFSDNMAMKEAGSAFKRLVLCLLPKKLGEDIPV